MLYHNVSLTQKDNKSFISLTAVLKTLRAAIVYARYTRSHHSHTSCSTISTNTY
jgi:hypothetical protein